MLAWGSVQRPFSMSIAVSCTLIGIRQCLYSAGLPSCSACSRSYGPMARLRRGALGQTLRVRSAEPATSDAMFKIIAVVVIGILVGIGFFDIGQEAYTLAALLLGIGALVDSSQKRSATPVTDDRNQVTVGTGRQRKTGLTTP